MASRLLLRSLTPRRLLSPGCSTRTFTTLPAPPRRTSKALLLSGAALGAGALAYALRAPAHADAAALLDAEEHSPQAHAQPPLRDLLRSYVVYTLCSVPFLVDYSPTILDACLAVPGVSVLTEAFVRATFFGQFVGADTAQECIPLLRKLRAERKGALLVYSAEAEADGRAVAAQGNGEATMPHKRAVAEVLRAIDAAADFEDALGAGADSPRQTWVAVKIVRALMFAFDAIAK
jgi:proline dehydrogenase